MSTITAAMTPPIIAYKKISILRDHPCGDHLAADHVVHYLLAGRKHGGGSGNLITYGFRVPGCRDRYNIILWFASVLPEDASIVVKLAKM